MVRDQLSVLSAFLAVAEERSFTKAAKRLGVSTSALSHAMRNLEEDIGVRLLARTTRSVSPTDAGAQLIAHLGPALGDIRGALEVVAGLRDKPAGRIKLLMPRSAALSVLAPKLAHFARAYPEVVLDVTTDSSRLDLVAAGFDAGIQLGEYIEQDMVAVRVSPDHHTAIVGAPHYFKRHPKPQSPRDLTQHQCLNFRHGSDGIYRWEFEKRNKPVVVSVKGPLIIDDAEIMIQAAIDGVGLAFTAAENVSTLLASGRLIRVLEDWSPPFSGYFLYYPSRRQQPAALSALIETLRI